MNSQLKTYFLFFIILVIGFTSCKDDKVEPTPPFNDGCYPPAVAEIIVKKCANSGCHNTASKDAASGLELNIWENMFLRNSNSATIVPYRSDQSTLFYFVNTDTLLGIVQIPNMPYNENPHIQSEILTICNWIDTGAPNCNGQIKFSDNPNHRKFYIANQGCDIVGVHDPITKVVMLYVDVGNKPAIEAPHVLRMSPDGQYWYAAFIFGDVLQKFRSTDDKLVAEASITQGSWNKFAIPPDGTIAWVIDLSTQVTGCLISSIYLKLTNSDQKLFIFD